MSVNGCIIPGTQIAVDFWKVRELNAQDFVFFLTHLHGDHIVGLTSTWQYPIYCSKLTAELLSSLYDINSSLLKPLEVGATHLVPVPSSDVTKTAFITVSLIDANHCPGSVMFLFEGSFGKILHTGDFRYKTNLIEESILFKHIDSIDVLYLDNTFCNPQCNFPPREEARITILKIIQEHSDYSVVLGMRNLGKEDLLVWLGLSLKEWISIPGTMYERIQRFDLPNVFQINDKNMRIRVEPFHLVSKKMLKKWNEQKRTIAILPTAIFTGLGGVPFANQDNIFIVPYSDHSSYTELVEFVSRLQPCCVVPIVSSKTRGPFGVDVSSRADMSCFDRYCRNKTENPNTRQFLRCSGRLTNKMPVNNMPVKRRSQKRKRCCSSKKVVKGVEYVSFVSVISESSCDSSAELRDRLTFTSSSRITKPCVSLKESKSNSEVDTKQTDLKRKFQTAKLPTNGLEKNHDHVQQISKYFSRSVHSEKQDVLESVSEGKSDQTSVKHVSDVKEINNFSVKQKNVVTTSSIEHSEGCICNSCYVKPLFVEPSDFSLTVSRHRQTVKRYEQNERKDSNMKLVKALQKWLSDC